VPTWESIVRARTDLSAAASSRLRMLIGEWALLSDLGFSDFVLFVRTWDAAGWIAIAHVRPSTSPTMFADDPVGAFVPRSHAATLERALLSLEPVRGRSRPDSGDGHRVRLAEPIEAVPVGGDDGAVVGMLGRYSTIDRRRIGEMEQNYLSACDSLLAMVTAGDYPVVGGEAVGAAAPRVGDGMIRLDLAGRVRYASPNARTCLRRLGVSDPVVGTELVELLSRVARKHYAVDRAAVRIAAGEALGETEFASSSAIITVRSIPLGSDRGPEGAVVLLRDVTELRSRERDLLSKDATIREIHHRVKNNLQTVGALLRLQARRMPAGAPRSALLDAVARVSTIALVHESLASSPGEQVDFDQISRRILAMARDAAAAQEHPAAHVTVTGSFGVLPSEVATPLAMVLSELLLNAMEHSRAGQVKVTGIRGPATVWLCVFDDGAGFDPAAAQGLGLQIVATLVHDQLHGSLSIRSDGNPPWPEALDGDPAGAAQAGGGTADSGTEVRIVCPV
jgi:two-component sensor histidine kinase